tara:strand:- start:229 stop:342 length:114 start_codon:yes stop_codon:yes gene_type:complete
MTKGQKLQLFYYLCRVYAMQNGRRVLVKSGGCGCGRK